MKKLIFSLILFICSLSVSAQAKLNINSVPEKLRVELKAKYPNLETGELSRYELDNLLKFIMSKGIFERASIETDESGLTEDYLLVVQFLKTIKSIRIEDEDEIDDSEILRALGITSGDRFETGLIQDLQQRIRNLYEDRGFHQTKADILITLNPDQSVNLTVKLNEGEPLRVSSISVDTANLALQKRLEKIAGSSKGKVLTSETITIMQTEMTEFLRHNRYIRADISAPKISENSNRTKANLVFSVLKGEQYSVIFEGNYNVPTTSLLDSLDLETFYSANPNVGSELVKRVKDYYLNRGFARVEVESEELDFQREATAKIKFKIKEGPRIQIRGFELDGDFSQPKEEYIQFITENSSEIIQDGMFHREDLETSIKNLVTHLQNQGYLKAKINTTRYQYDKNKANVTIYIDLDEGPLTRIKDIIFEGNQRVPKAELIALMNLKNGDPLRLIELEESLRKLKLEYQEKGFLEMRLLNETDPSLVAYSEDNTEAQLIIKVAEGPRIKVNAIVVDGNTITKEFVVRKELDFKEGDYLSPSRLTESNRRLQKTGLFSSIEIRTLEENTQIAQRTIIVKVTDRNPGLLNFGAGFTNERELTLRGFTGLAYRNIDGLAKAISGRLDVNYNVTDIKYPEFKITFGYLEPYLLNSRTKGRINVTRSVLVTDYEKRQATDTQNATFSLEQNITSHVMASYEIWGINTIKDFPIDEDSTAQYQIQNIGTTGPGIEIDFRDHPFNPTSGSLTRMNVEFSHPDIGSSRGIEYLRSTASFNHYYPILGSTQWVYANQIRGGVLENLSDLSSGGVPYSKKGFTLGGISTIRGFEAGTSERFPNDADLGSDNFFLQTKAQFALIKSELRFPIKGNFGGAIFYDGGMVEIAGLDFQDNYRDSAGIGFRYMTPVGPVMLEFAWKLDRKKDRNESPYRFHFSIGSF